MTIRVLLADDHTMVRQALRRTMEAEGFDVVGEAGDGDEAVRQAVALLPDVVLMDVSMPVRDGVEATRLVRRRAPSVKVVVLTMHGDADVVRRAVDAGAAGYLTKDCTTAEVVEAIRLAASGETVLSPELAAAMLAAGGADADILSRREQEVLALVATGASTTEVGTRLFISPKTVKNHLSSIYEKLDARDRTEAVLRAVRLGIIRLS
ncbi:MAG: response regulator transcription factor [Acidimicrobiales bacterium]